MATKYDDCDPASYYSSLSDAPSASLTSKMHDLVKSTHRTVLPYTSNSGGGEDVWSALIDVDGWGSRVRLIYRSILMESDLKGVPEGWNREHLWPKSYGVGYSGADFTDVHHLRPADWGVNAARGNKQFSSCFDQSDCNVPANAEAAEDTSSDTERWMPPAAVRGDIARALFYMHLRYNGDDDPDNKDLILSDCPSKEDARLGYLSELLRWHVEDPVDSMEVTRNKNVCERYQGNRNPFVDHPEYVTPVFGEPKSAGEINCHTLTTSPTLSPKEPPNSSLERGDIIPIAMNSNNPDSIIFLPLVDLPQLSTIYVTDNAWTGNAFYENEGRVSFTVPEGGIKKGNTFGYGAGSFSEDWKSEGGYFSLSTQGDSILVYCFKSDADGNGANNDNYSRIHFLGGISTGSGGWVERDDGTLDYDYGTTQSSVPQELEGIAAPALPKKKNVFFMLNIGKCKAKLSCTAEEVLLQYMNLDNWSGSDTEGYDTSLVDSSFPIEEVGGGGDWLQKEGSSDMIIISVGVTVLFSAILGCALFFLCKARKNTPKGNRYPPTFELPSKSRRSTDNNAVARTVNSVPRNFV